MRNRIFAIILALTVVSWAQSSNSNPSTTTAEKSACSCCEKMAGSDSGKADCCAQHGKDGKAMAASCSREKGKCCGGDAKSCMRAEKGKSCCSECGKEKASTCCGDKCAKACKGRCDKQEQKTETHCAGNPMLAS